MTEAKFEVKFTATAEVRDKDGNLISDTPVEFRHEVPEQHLREMGLTEEQIAEIKQATPVAPIEGEPS